MPRYLLIDDRRDPERFGATTVARTSDEAISELNRGGWDRVYFDNDMGPDQKEGWQIVVHMMHHINPDKWPKELVVVSDNTPARANIESKFGSMGYDRSGEDYGKVIWSRTKGNEETAKVASRYLGSVKSFNPSIEKPEYDQTLPRNYEHIEKELETAYAHNMPQSVIDRLETELAQHVTEENLQMSEEDPDITEDVYGRGGVAGAIEEQMAYTYSDYLKAPAVDTPGIPYSKQDLVKRMRNILEESKMAPSMLPNVTDAQVLDAAKDAYEHRRKYIQQYRQKSTKRPMPPTTYGVISRYAMHDPGEVAWEVYNERYMQEVGEAIDNIAGNQPPKKLIPLNTSRMKKIWRDYSRTGVVRDERGIDDILDDFLEKTVRIDVNNYLTGHTPADPLEEFKDREISIPKDVDERIDRQTNDIHGHWMISDYGIGPLQRLLHKAMMETDYEQKLLALDAMLNVVHQRSDLASWFVQGGRGALDAISQDAEEKTESYKEASMEKTAVDAKKVVDQIGLPDRKGAYAIHTSNALLVRGLRKEVKDYDILTSPEVFKQVQEKFPENCDMHGKDERVLLNIDGTEIEIFKTWWGGMDPEKILRQAEKINGVWYASLEDVKEWKERRWEKEHLEKDRVDLEEINRYMNTRKASDYTGGDKGPLEDVEVIKNGNRIEIKDSLGGKAQVDLINNTARIYSIHSVPDDKKYTDEASQYKRRGFFKKVIEELRNLGVQKISVSLQSTESRAALKRMVETGVLENPQDIRGLSVDEYPTTFDIPSTDTKTAYESEAGSSMRRVVGAYLKTAIPFIESDIGSVDLFLQTLSAEDIQKFFDDMESGKSVMLPAYQGRKEMEIRKDIMEPGEYNRNLKLYRTHPHYGNKNPIFMYRDRGFVSTPKKPKKFVMEPMKSEGPPKELNPEYKLSNVVASYMKSAATGHAADSSMFYRMEGDKVLIKHDDVPIGVWNKFSRAMNALDYDFRGGEDAKKLLDRWNKRSSGETVLSGDHAKGFLAAVGKADLHKPLKGSDASSIIKKAIKKFGITNNPHHAGYILPDGRLLDFSGGAGALGTRGADHREIGSVIPESMVPEGSSQWNDVVAFGKLGNIRTHVSGRGQLAMTLFTRPTSAQLQAVEDIMYKEHLGATIDVGRNNKEFGPDEVEDTINFMKQSTSY
jgi:hypothetical protein